LAPLAKDLKPTAPLPENTEKFQYNKMEIRENVGLGVEPI